MNDYNEIINEALKELKENADNFNEITKKAFVQIIIKDDDDELIKKFLNYGNVFARQAMAKYGNNEIRWQLINDKAWPVRLAIAKNGTDEMRSHLIDDEEHRVRARVAKYGSKEMCEILKNDKDEDVRNKAEERLRDLEALFKKIIAKYGTDVKRWRLIDDEDVLIRLAVAKYGSKEKCEILKNDKDEYVRRVAENRLEELKKKRIKESEE